MSNYELKGNTMKKILGFFLIALALLAVTQTMQAQDKIPMSAAFPVMVREFQIDTIKLNTTDSTCLFYVPYSMNVVGLTATAFAIDTTISAGHTSKTGGIVKLYKYTPATQIAGDTVATINLFTSEYPVCRRVIPSGKLTIGSCYKVSVASTADGYLYRVKIAIHYTR